MKRFLLRIIRSIEQKLKKGSVLKNVIVVYFFTVIIPTGIILCLYYGISMSSIKKEMSESIYKTVEQAAQHIDLRLARIEEISDDIFMNHMYNDALLQSEEKPVFEQMERYEELSGNIEIFQRRDDIQYVRLYFKKPLFYTNEHVNFFKYSEIEQEPWLAEIEKRKGAIVWIGARKQRYADGTEESVLTCARLMKNLRDINEVTGALLIDVKESNIRQILEETKVSDAEQMFLFDKEGNCMADYGTNNGISTDEARHLTSRNGIWKDNGMYYMSFELANSRWSILTVMPENAVVTSGVPANKFINLLFFVIILSLFVMVFFLLFGYLIMCVTWRINKIVHKLECGGFESIESIVNGESDEGADVNLLEKYVDRMITKVNELMQEAYDARIEKQKAEFQSLQAQINPHFLYNTLDNISWMALRANAQDVCDIIQTLSQYFRLSLSNGKDVVTIENELQLAKVYIDIQNSRFKGIINSEINVDDRLRFYSIPKLTLQPLLENAVIHGLQPKDNKDWNIIISGEEKDDDVYLFVEDNGVGMPAEKTELRAEGEHGYGMFSVNRRLQLYCGDDYGLKIESVPGRGTRICVKLCKRNCDK